MSDRTYDLVLLGATGFTGGLVAEHLARRLEGTDVQWAVAGRSQDKLDDVRDRVAALGVEPAIEVVDVHDLVGLLRLAEQTRVLATTVGPYADHGELVVQACVRSGTHYADITGEPAFVDRMISIYDADARERGVKLVPCCGFDSIPHDLGARFTAEQLPSDAPMTIRGFVRAKGTASGGTWNSAVKAMGESDLRSVGGGPRPSSADGRRARGLPLRVERVPEIDAWGVPLPTIDPVVVLRSARALDAYGPDFRYGHYAHVKQLTTVAGMVGGAGLLMGLARVGPTRDLLLKLRQSGEGPSEEQRDASWFRVTFLGEAGGKKVTTRVSGGDPGYTETARMLGEAALSLAFDDLPDVAGVLTTAQAFEGGALQRRLESQGMKFEVLSTS